MKVRVHDVKIHPEWFDAVDQGKKRWELRKDDRGYEVGDVLVLREWDPVRKTYTGRETIVRVRRIWRDLLYVPADVVLLDVELVDILVNPRGASHG